MSTTPAFRSRTMLLLTLLPWTELSVSSDAMTAFTLTLSVKYALHAPAIVPLVLMLIPVLLVLMVLMSTLPISVLPVIQLLKAVLSVRSVDLLFGVLRV
jgi:hypothetical protein